ncbi:thiamine-phosphate pyrophosphorylase [Enterococcus moraviensis ATCC BAA-383]|uniref:Thiamine-phosphate synthase n=1 Tax=Enterococcus moraviensis ATCC BAA-383 TaxID=1158609 RepID=R2R290_9ENTE|nr:thiamine-phosphate pyrophosphorylase [Enterococcus moraviensis ATCC BAA-383]EOT73719.1 thiamine-phosphate pyrophosphorylase [Enterococcus moraviensis ATCC BAA-383]
MAQPIIGHLERLSIVKNTKEMLSVYFIAGTQDIIEGTLPSILEEALKAGITCFQYREKGQGSLTEFHDKMNMAKICQSLCREYEVPFLINDDVELALKIDADGIHVGQDNQDIQEVIGLFPTKIVGLSCHDQHEIIVANQLEKITYYGIGPVYGTQSKPDAEKPIGIKTLQHLIKEANKPVVAIGGISTENVSDVLATDVDGVSVISAITRTENIRETVKSLQ